MPKGRRNSIATGGGGGSSVSAAATDFQGSDNTAEQINERLREAGTVRVQINSRSRNQLEDLEVTFSDTPGMAQVRSGSGNTYSVDYINGGCTCMHHTMREERCRHMDAVDMAMGQVIDGQSLGNDINAIENLVESDTIEEINRNEIMVDQEDDEFFYLDNEDEFERKLRDGVNVPYEYENVLNGSDVTFGIELEFVGGDADAIARDLYREGICAFDHRVSYHARSVEGKWKLERDGSVSNGSHGGELVSPVLKDTPETWENIEKICKIAKRHGARIDDRCGGHVHIGMEPLDTARQRWRRFFNVMSGYEECIYRAAGGDEGRIRSGHRHYAESFQHRADYGSSRRIRLESIDDVRDLAEDVSQRNRYYALNLKNVAEMGKPDTVEFRYFNGSLNAKQIQANVKLSAGVMMAARKCRTKNIDSIGYEVSDAFKRRGKLVKNPNNTASRSNKKIAEFLDVICTRKRDKDALLNVFAKNTWR